MIASRLETIVFDGFDDPRLTSQTWADLLAESDTNTINLSYHWLKNWWQHLGHGHLMLVGAQRDGQLVALAPLFIDGGMVFNLCPEDCLDFIGETNTAEVVEALLRTARDRVADFAGIKLYFIADSSRTTGSLQDAARSLGLVCHREGALPSPFLDLATHPEHAQACLRKKSLLRHERGFLNDGRLEVHHFKSTEDILPQLDAFFDQHIGRRAATSHASLFLDPRQRDYYRAQTTTIGPLGWLRFTRLDFNGQPIAYHYGLCSRGRFLFGIPSFDINLAHRSPGEVLLRQLLIGAVNEGATRFDFGIGDEPYKSRFATGTNWLCTWGFYPQ